MLEEPEEDSLKPEHNKLPGDHSQPFEDDGLENYDDEGHEELDPEDQDGWDETTEGWYDL